MWATVFCGDTISHGDLFYGHEAVSSNSTVRPRVLIVPSEVAFATHKREKKKNDKQSNAGGRCGFITRIFHSAILSSRARRRNDWRWIFIIRDNNSSHFIDICGIRNFGLFKVKDIGAIRHEKLYDKLISHIYHAAKRKLESLPKALIYLLDILRCLIF